MFDIAWTEFGVIGLVAVLVLGPKELPQAMRALGRFTRKARKLSGEFQSHFSELMREAELDEVKNSVKEVTNTNVGEELSKLIDPGGAFSAELAKTESEVKAALDTRPEIAAEAAVAPTPEASLGSPEAAAMAASPAQTAEAAALAPTPAGEMRS